eukprot:TRINITY_DN8431_c0_g4_i4.p3 TRINITY_DN8431_c0_g4~~TRINITY_DN8431_c0_g4_i4.p3  ORF type:complete len:105 (-),score=16.14 TRINITY_DN8431_c0_g4_i4:29-343(-)
MKAKPSKPIFPSYYNFFFQKEKYKSTCIQNWTIIPLCVFPLSSPRDTLTVFLRVCLGMLFFCCTYMYMNKSIAKYLSLIHISEPTRRTPISYAVFCLKKKKLMS